jgi:preprotein translocase subunit YajC
MNFFISDAWAQAAGASSGPGMTDLIFFVAIILMFYFMLIRPQMKRQKEHKKMVSEMAKGDEVVTNGGLLGKITKVGDDFLTVQIADGVEVKVQRAQVAAVMPKGTIKNS